jgi:hypothetical protein
MNKANLEKAEAIQEAQEGFDWALSGDQWMTVAYRVLSDGSLAMRRVTHLFPTGQMMKAVRMLEDNLQIDITSIRENEIQRDPLPRASIQLHKTPVNEDGGQ